MYLLQKIKLMKRVKNKEDLNGLGDNNFPLNGRFSYAFNVKEYEKLSAISEELHAMCKDVVEDVIDKELFYLFNIPESWWLYIESSFLSSLDVYGRFDFAYKSGEFKLLEYNADTPALLYESVFLQQEVSRLLELNNPSILEISLIKRWLNIAPSINNKLCFASSKESPIDINNTRLLSKLARKAGIDSYFTYLEELSVINNTLYDGNKKIDSLYKLYPWEVLFEDSAGFIKSIDNVFEPAWKVLLSGKAILPLLWKKYPNHPNLLPAFFPPEEIDCNRLVKKPIYSREGNGVVFVDGVHSNYESCILQQYFEIQKFSGLVPIIGSWMVGDKFSGLGIRESTKLITDSKSIFVPYFCN